MMEAKDFRKEQDYPYNHFTILTSTGISPNYDNIEEYAEAYHQSKVKTLGLSSASSTSDEFGEIGYNRDIADTCTICKYLPNRTNCKACVRCEEIANIARYYR